MIHPARNPAIRHGAGVPDNKTFHAPEFLRCGELARLWLEESCGRRARNRCAQESSRARPARRHRTHFAVARPCQILVLEVLTSAAHGLYTLHASLSDRTE